MEINVLIRREMKRNHLLQTTLAHKLGVQSTTVHGMLNRPDMPVSRLIELSEVFQYNFFREIAQTLPYKDPDYEVKFDEEAMKAPLLEQIKTLQTEVDILRKTLKDLVTR